MHSSPTMLLSFCLALFFGFSNGLVADVRSKDCDGSTPVLPLTGVAPELPSTNLTLVYVAIGRGVQNYTCSAVNATAVATGAIATLYDATKLAYADEAAVHAISPIAVYAPVPPRRLHIASGSLKVLGNHYFDAAGTPTFNLSTVKKIFFGAKTGGVKAPATADKGPLGTGAVDWLQLSAKGTYTSVGVKVVYRVETAGGVAPLCPSKSPLSVPYAAEYWFYD